MAGYTSKIRFLRSLKISDSLSEQKKKVSEHFPIHWISKIVVLPLTDKTENCQPVKNSISLAFGDLCINASHNPCQGKETISAQLEFISASDCQSGRIAIEIHAIGQSENHKDAEITSGYFKASHLQGSSKGSHPGEWQRHVFGWHSSSQNHMPIIAHADIKIEKPHQ